MAPEELAAFDGNNDEEKTETPNSEIIQEEETHQPDLEDEEAPGFAEIDFGQLGKEEIIQILEKELSALRNDGISAAVFKQLDELVREVKPVLDQFKRTELDEARTRYIEENGNEEGFAYKSHPETQKIEELCRQLREEKSKYYKQLDRAKEDNFNIKTGLLQRLRELVEEEENKETDDAKMKAGWEGFKKIQEEWKAAGNINSPHNGTLWATYNALVDRYFSIRNIYFELKELDRKRNAELKQELCEKIEGIADSIDPEKLSREALADASQLFEEYKHVGPAPREEQEALWQRFKEAMDRIYDARRAQSGEIKRQAAEVYEAKSKIYEAIVPFTSFTSGSINDWNAKTKELLAYQNEWVAIKGPLPKDEGKDLSKKFWSALKTFFHNKGEFFRQLESKREINLKAKTELCEEAESILSQGEDNAQNTQRIIELQKRWKGIGQVPEKFKDSIFVRFKTACDAYFDKKRSKNQAVEKEFEQNLEQKQALCARIEELAASDVESTLEQLNSFKEEWTAIGFVPKKDLQAIQKRYIAAVNAYVSAIGKLSSKEKELVSLESEVEVVKGGESERGLYRKENDIRKKITQLESNIAVWQNNIQFFAKSKTSDKLKSEFEKKIASAEAQLSDLKHQLLIIQEAI